MSFPRHFHTLKVKTDPFSPHRTFEQTSNIHQLGAKSKLYPKIYHSLHALAPFHCASANVRTPFKLFAACSFALMTTSI